MMVLAFAALQSGGTAKDCVEKSSMRVIHGRKPTYACLCLQKEKEESFVLAAHGRQYFLQEEET
jgi:hypothetical protein